MHLPYHVRMLQLYREETFAMPDAGADALGVDHWPAWREVVEVLPQGHEAMVTLANEVVQQGRFGEAMALYRHLAHAYPEDARIHHNLGSLLRAAGALHRAIASYRRVLELDPSRGDTALALAELLVGTDPAEAQALVQNLGADGSCAFAIEQLRLRIRLAQTPSESDELSFDELEKLSEGDFHRQLKLLSLLFEHGSQRLAPLLLERLGVGPQSWSAPVARLVLLLQFRPQDQAGIQKLLNSLQCDYGEEREVLLFLSRLEREQQRYGEALELAERALAIDPLDPRCNQEAGVNLFSLGRHREAIERVGKGLEVDPLNARACRTLGLLHYAIAEIDQSRHWLFKSLRLLPRAGGEAWSACAQCLRLFADLDGALQAVNRGLQDHPDYPLARLIRGTLLIQQGDYARAWPDYECRIHPELVRVVPPEGLGRWDGASDLDELVLVSEQGVGDLVQFLRYVPFFLLAIPRVSILVDHRLRGLMELAGVFSAVFVNGEPIQVSGKAAWLPILSVPSLLGITPDCVLMDQPYLNAPPQSRERWTSLLRAELTPRQRLIGLHWQGNPATETMALVGRSFPLALLEPLTTVADRRFVSLQKGAGSEQLAACPFRQAFVSAQPEVDACWDYVETTAIIAACDLIITSDSGVAHLAGALGLPVWLLLPHIPEWRWGLEGATSHWYATMRVFRQPTPGDWSSVIREVREALITDVGPP